MPSHIVESSEVFVSEELSYDNPIKAPEISQILRRIAKKRRRSSTKVVANTTMPLREESHEFMDTLCKFVDCRNKMDEQCNLILQENPLLASSNLCELDVDDLELDPIMKQYNDKYQQQSVFGYPVQGLCDLYQAAKQVKPIFDAKLNELVQDFLAKDASQQDIVLQVADLKDAGRALEKAKEDYGDRLSGPSASWLYDVVRASIVFTSSPQLLQFVEQLSEDASLTILQSKNRFQRPAVSGYRDWCLHLQVDTGLGFSFVCELQLHLKAILELSQQVGSYQYYQALRFYFGNSHRDMEDRIQDLQAIAPKPSKEGNKKYQLQMDALLSDEADLDRLKRLAHLFHYHLQEYEIAARLECQVLLTAKVCDVADSYETIGSILLKQNRSQESKLMHEQALQLRLDTMGIHHKSVASSYFHLGLVLEQQEQHYTALTFHNRALAIRMQLREDALVIASLNQIGVVWEHLAQWEDAKYNYQQALQIRMDTLGETDVLVASSYSNIGCVLEQQGKYQLALEAHEKALAIRREIFSNTNHRSIPYSLNKIGGVLKELQKYEEAKDMHQEALDIQLELFDKPNPSVAASYNNLGAIAMRQGDYEGAETMHRKALQIRLETLGEDHISVANTYSTLGVILAKQRRYQDARDMHERALAIRLQALGHKHVSVASSYHCLGVVLEKQGEYKEAETMHKRALEIRSEILGEDHSTVSTSSKRLQGVLEKQVVTTEEGSESSSGSTGSMIRSTVNKIRSVMRKSKSKEANKLQRIQLDASAE